MGQIFPQKIEEGFTIVELLIVIVVIAILAAISVVAYNGIQDRASDSAVKSDLRNIGQKIAMYHTADGAYPEETTDLNGLVRVTASAYSTNDNPNNFVYCWRGGESPRFSVAGRSKSGTGFYYSSRDGLTQMEGWSNGVNTLCPMIGITQPGYPYGGEYIRHWGNVSHDDWTWWVDTN